MPAARIASAVASAERFRCSFGAGSAETLGMRLSCHELVLEVGEVGVEVGEAAFTLPFGWAIGFPPGGTRAGAWMSAASEEPV